VRKKLLEAALGYYQDFLEQEKENPQAAAALEKERARVQKIIDELSALQAAPLVDRVHEPSVQDDLQLTNDQRLAVARLMTRVWEQRINLAPDGQNLTGEGRRQRFAEQAKVNEHSLEEILTVRQMKRLREIDLQLK